MKNSLVAKLFKLNNITPAIIKIKNYIAAWENWKTWKARLKNIKVDKRAFLVIPIIILCGSALYLIFPLWPKIVYGINPPKKTEIDYPISYPSSYSGLSFTSNNSKPIPTANRLVIPKIGVDAEILDSSSLDILFTKEGVWREPQSANPLLKGNMVIAGHRFQYTPPNTNTFYNLDDVKNGDRIIVFWQKHSYIYEVYKTSTVDPTDIAVRIPDIGIQHEITLYTCTPLYTSKDRYVINAKLLT